MEINLMIAFCAISIAAADSINQIQQHSTQEYTAIPAGVGEAAPSPSSGVHILKPIAVMLILAMIAAATTALIRICSNTKNEPRSAEIERADSERLASQQKESIIIEIKSEPPERRTDQPRRTVNCCNNWKIIFGGLSP